MITTTLLVAGGLFGAQALGAAGSGSLSTGVEAHSAVLRQTLRRRRRLAVLNRRRRLALGDGYNSGGYGGTRRRLPFLPKDEVTSLKDQLAKVDAHVEKGLPIDAQTINDIFHNVTDGNRNDSGASVYTMVSDATSVKTLEKDTADHYFMDARSDEYDKEKFELVRGDFKNQGHGDIYSKTGRKVYYPPYLATRQNQYDKHGNLRKGKRAQFSNSVWQPKDIDAYKVPFGWTCQLCYDDTADLEIYESQNKRPSDMSEEAALEYENSRDAYFQENRFVKDFKYHGERSYCWVANNGYCVTSKPDKPIVFEQKHKQRYRLQNRFKSMMKDFYYFDELWQREFNPINALDAKDGRWEENFLGSGETVFVPKNKGHTFDPTPQVAEITRRDEVTELRKSEERQEALVASADRRHKRAIRVFQQNGKYLAPPRELSPSEKYAARATELSQCVTEI